MTHRNGDRVNAALIDRLPVETLTSIFESCLLEDTERQDDHAPLIARRSKKPRPGKAPLLFCQISSRWRTIALSIPQLWTVISIEFDLKNVDDRTALLDAWLKRSGKLPIEVHLVRVDAIHPDPSYDPDPELWWLHNTVGHHLQRMTELNLQGIKMKAVLDILEARSPPILLHTLHVSTRALTRQDAQPSLALEAPRLRKLTLCTPNMSPTKFKFPWGQLVELELSGGCLTVNDGLDILILCPALRRCVILFDQFWTVRRPDDSPILLPGLHSLDLRSRTNLAQFFNNVTLPALKELKVACSSVNANSIPFAPFHSFLQRSGALVETLGLSGVRAWNNDLVDWLSLVPAVTSFALLRSDRPRTDTLHRALEATEDTAPILPKLERLSLDMHSGPDTFDQSLPDFLSSRWRLRPRVCAPEEAVSRLLSVELHPLGIGDLVANGFPEMEQELDWLREEGMCIYVEGDEGV